MLILALPAQSAEITGGWKDDLFPKAPGPFAVPENSHAKFVFGWANLPAGEAEFTFQRRTSREYEAKFSGRTTGAARSLWQADIFYETRGLIAPRQPLWFRQTEIYRRHRIEIEAEFTTDAVRRIRRRIPSREEAQWRTFEIANTRDLLGTMLFVHSQRLAPGGREIVTLCFPGDAPYLVRVRPMEIETLDWRGAPLRALRLSISLQRIGTKGAERGQLRPHRRFRSGSVWLSADKSRLPLRAEVSIFIGFVYAELIGWEFVP